LVISKEEELQSTNLYPDASEAERPTTRPFFIISKFAENQKGEGKEPTRGKDLHGREIEKQRGSR